MHDEAALWAEVTEGVQPFHVIVRRPKAGESRLAHAGHDAHAHRHIRTVGNFHANLAIWGSHRSHNVGHHVHGTALHGTGKTCSDPGFGVGWGHPVVVRSSILALAWADIGQVLGPGHVCRITAVQIAARVLFLVQLYQGARFEHVVDHALVFNIRAIAPVDILRTGELGAFLNPLLNGGCHRQILSWSAKSTTRGTCILLYPSHLQGVKSVAVFIL